MHGVKLSFFKKETIALGEGADTSYLRGNLMQRIFMLPKFLDMKNMTDSTSFLTPSEKQTVLTRDLRLTLNVARLVQTEKNGEKLSSWAEGKNFLADCMIKHNELHPTILVPSSKPLPQLYDLPNPTKICLDFPNSLTSKISAITVLENIMPNKRVINSQQ